MPAAAGTQAVLEELRDVSQLGAVQRKPARKKGWTKKGKAMQMRANA